MLRPWQRVEKVRRCTELLPGEVVPKSSAQHRQVIPLLHFPGFCKLWQTPLPLELSGAFFAKGSFDTINTRHWCFAGR